MRPDGDTRFEAVIGPIETAPAVSDTDSPVLRLTLDARHLADDGTAHGGPLMGLAQAALGACVAREASNSAARCVSLNCDFTGAPQPGDVLEARAAITRRTRSIAFVSGDITASGRVVMTATGVWRLSPVASDEV